jgi:phenylpropionate dioxygenase-like ring-hydroxylating dioxygenase large terminal subunit
MLQDPVLMNDWHAVAFSSDLPEGGVKAARLLSEDVVLWRVNGQVMAWRDLCLHRGSRLSLGRVKADTLVCPYHGWTYNTGGKCIVMPAHPEQTPSPRAVVDTYQVSESTGFIWVCPGESKQPPPTFSEWNDASYRKVACGPYDVDASGPRVIENFLDVAHFPFVHEGLLGDQDHTEIEEYDVVTDENGVTADNIKVWQPDPDGTGQAKEVVYTYKVFRPLTAYFTKKTEGPQFAIFFTITPVDPVRSLGWMWIAMNYAHDMPEEEVRGFQDTVFAQDRPIVEGQRPELLPLDLQAELHLRSDKTAIAYRKWLNDLGLSFGTS